MVNMFTVFVIMKIDGYKCYVYNKLIRILSGQIID